MYLLLFIFTRLNIVFALSVQECNTTTTANPVRTLTGYSGKVSSLTTLSDGVTLISTAEDDTIKVWNSTSGILTNSLSPANGIIFRTVVTLPGDFIAAGTGSCNAYGLSCSGKVYIWSFAGTLVKTLVGHIDDIWSLAPVSNVMLASGGGAKDETIKLWNF